MTTREGIRIMPRREDEPPPPPERRGSLWRLEYTLLVGISLLMTVFAIAFFYFGADTSNLRPWGYAGVFLINLVGSASILLPPPAVASVFGGGAPPGHLLAAPAVFWGGPR